MQVVGGVFLFILCVNIPYITSLLHHDISWYYIIVTSSIVQRGSTSSSTGVLVM